MGEMRVAGLGRQSRKTGSSHEAMSRMMKPQHDKHTIGKELLYVGFDVHAQTVSIALAEQGGEVRNYGSVSSCLSTLGKTMCCIRNAHPGAELRVCYEAGPTGFVVARRFAQLGIDCTVLAPSLIPNRSGDRVQTDPRDAVKLARLHRAGELTGVHVPDATDEAMREDLRRGRAQLKAFLLRNGYRYSGRVPGQRLIGRVQCSARFRRFRVLHGSRSGWRRGYGKARRKANKTKG
jgi:hypothetical protein